MTDKNTIIVTRPAGQADILLAAIDRTHSSVLHFPAMEIIRQNAEQCELAMADNWDWVIFISANAVRSAAPYWQDITNNTKIIAVGSGTANECVLQQLPSAITPKEYSVLGMLQLPELQDINKQKILICSAEGSSPELADSLKLRGATVHVVNCYRRICTKKNLPQLPDPSRSLLIVTSSGGLQNLLKMAQSEAETENFKRCDLLLLHPNQTAAAIAANWLGKIIVAQETSDSGLLKCINSWQAEQLSIATSKTK